MSINLQLLCSSKGGAQEPLATGEPAAAAFQQEVVGGSRCHCCVSREH